MLDHLALAIEAERAVHAARHRHHGLIKPRRERGVQRQFAAQEMFPRGGRAEVQEAQLDRFLELPGGRGADENGRDMGLDRRLAAHRTEQRRDLGLLLRDHG